MADDLKARGNIEDHGGESGFFELEGGGVVEGFDGGAGLTVAESDVDLAVVFAVEEVLGTDHG